MHGGLTDPDSRAQRTDVTTTTTTAATTTTTITATTAASGKPGAGR